MDLRKQTTEAGQLWEVKKGESTNSIDLIKNTQNYQAAEVLPTLTVENNFTKG